jgi:hypothetical protein
VEKIAHFLDFVLDERNFPLVFDGKICRKRANKTLPSYSLLEHVHSCNQQISLVSKQKQAFSFSNLNNI